MPNSFLDHQGCSLFSTLNSRCILVRASKQIRQSMLLMMQPFSELVDSNHNTCLVTLLAVSFRKHSV